MPAFPSSFIPVEARAAFKKIEQWMRAHETVPRMTTTQRNTLASPTPGLMIYNTTTNKLNVFTTVWEQVTSV